ncbi:MAG TPA: hypothetical protein VEL07_18990 [Planctomycetota bacterium]|nr:hypothetical protein [Planctomycetota bacterium]
MNLRIATPCHEDWSGMTPNGPGRHCASCDKTVVDLTALTPAASSVAMVGLADRVRAGEHLCVRAHADASGGLRATRARRRLLTNGMAAMLAMAMASGLTGCGGGDQPGAATTGQVQQDPEPVDPHPRETMGEMRVPDPVPEPAVEPQPVAVEPLMGAVAAPEPVEADPAIMGDVCVPEAAPAPEPETVVPTTVPATMGRIRAE